MSLPIRTIADIRGQHPCYDPTRYLPANWQGTALDILRVTACPAQDRLWVVLQKGWLSDRTFLLFAAWAARQALALVAQPDPRSLAACATVERYANGQASRQELTAAADAAYAAADAAADAAARAAAYAAAYAAARAAADAAAYAAAYAAADAAAYAAAYAVQIAQLITMLEDENDQA